MKKLLVIMLALLMTFAAFGCTSGDVKEPSSVSTVTERPSNDEVKATEPNEPEETEPDETEPEETEPDETEPEEPEETEEPTEAPTEAPTAEPTAAPFNGEVTVEKTELLNKKGVKITLKEYEDNYIFGPSFKMLVENESGKDLTVTVSGLCVNGYMNSGLLYCTVADGKKANDELYLSESDLELCGIDTVAEIEFSFHIIDDDYDTYLDSDRIKVKTSAYGSYTQTYDDSGILAYEGKGIKIVAKGVEEDSIFGPTVLYYVENNSGKNIYISTNDVSVNGFMVDDLLYFEVLKGMRGIAEETFLSSSLEENDIDEIEEVELSFHISNADKWETIVDTKTITIKFD